jgi:ABC-2 type transport system permease protein
MSPVAKELTRFQAVRASAAAFFRVTVIEEFNYPATFVMKLFAIVTPLIPFFFISELVGDSERVGGDYLTFTVIGLSMTALMSGAMVGFGTTLQRSFQRGTLETFLVEPIPWSTLPLAMNQWQVLQGILYSLIIMGTGLLLGANIDLAGIPETTVLALLGVTSGLSLGIISAAVLLLTLKSTPVLRVYDIAASLLAGSIFSVSQLPNWAQALAVLLPHTYVINGSRTALMPDPGTFVMPFGRAVTALLIFDVIAFPFGIWLWNRTLRFSRKLGHLGGY